MTDEGIATPEACNEVSQDPVWTQRTRSIIGGMAVVGTAESAFLSYNKLFRGPDAMAAICGVSGGCGDVLTGPYSRSVALSVCIVIALDGTCESILVHCKRSKGSHLLYLYVPKYVLYTFAVPFLLSCSFLGIPLTVPAVAAYGLVACLALLPLLLLQTNDAGETIEPSAVRMHILLL
jgi:uncharacterized membrane protein